MTRRSQGKSWGGSHWIRPSSRLLLYDRDGFACVYCLREVTTLTLDHLLPASEGGTNERSNLVTACFECNTARAGMPIGDWLKEVSDATGERRQDLQGRIDLQRKLVPSEAAKKRVREILESDPEWYRTLRAQASTSFRGLVVMAPEQPAYDGIEYIDAPF